MPKTIVYACDNCETAIDENDGPVEIDVVAQGYGTDPNDEDMYLPGTEIDRHIILCRACYKKVFGPRLISNEESD